jgi:hypothetical protein
LVFIYPEAEPDIRAPEPKPGEGYEPHPMIPSGDKRGAELQERLREVGIDINEAVNGVWLPKNSDVPNNGETPHNETFRKSYFEELNIRFNDAKTREDFESVLDDLRIDLKNRQIELPYAGGK